MDARDLWRKLIKPPRKVMMKKRSGHTIGDQGERHAEEYLTQRGLSLIECNYRCRYGEIDLIMREHDYIVFVEVKQRKHARFGSPLEMVSPSKQEKLRLAAQHYIASNKVSAHQPMRFDVVGIVSGTVKPDVQWVQNAF